MRSILYTQFINKKHVNIAFKMGSFLPDTQAFISSCVKTMFPSLWRWLVEKKILAQQKRVVIKLNKLIKEYLLHPISFASPPKKNFSTDKIIWQYWAQGFENAPDIIKKCLNSVNQFAPDYTIIRLNDENLHEYLTIPDFIIAKREKMTTAHFSDILRLMLLKTYGGIWMDATIMLTGPIPLEYATCDLFAFQRDPAEPHFRYWKEVNRYYFGWVRNFHVNMLNSFIVAKKGNYIISQLCDLIMMWWQNNDSISHYFLFQILFDVFCKDSISPLVNDTYPHYLQQSLKDPNFNIMERSNIQKVFSIHKLTYRNS